MRCISVPRCSPLWSPTQLSSFCTIYNTHIHYSQCLTSSKSTTTRAKPFEPDKWIGVGKIYPTENVPVELRAACDKAFAVPPIFKSWIPHSSTPISRLICETLPTRSATLNTTKISKRFSQDTPVLTNANDFQILDSRSRPSKDVVHLLRRSREQAWLDGNQSVSDPRYNNGKDRPSLWISSYRQQMLNIVTERRDWKAAAMVCLFI
jgi:hypothetical protein